MGAVGVQRFIETLYGNYPELFPDQITGLQCGSGWFHLIDGLCWAICAHSKMHQLPFPVVEEIKEKYGELRVYVRESSAAQEAMITLVERLSERVCEVCGAPGCVYEDNSGWLYTRCEQHIGPGVPIGELVPQLKELDWQYFRNKYPKIFGRENTIDQHFGIECGPGWGNLLDLLLSSLQKHADEGGHQSQAEQVKEKFGGLRYYGTADEIQDAQILVAQMVSARICEVCGGVTEWMNGEFQTRARCRAHIRDEESGLIHRYGLNEVGRDFIVGDLHGQLAELQRQMSVVGFDTKRDRLFSVGDLVDRGPDSMGCVDLLDEPWFHAVRGNHEQDLIDYAANRDPDLLAKLRRDGAEWVVPCLDEIDDIARRFDEMPFAIEIATRDGLVGIIHADIPSAKGWGELRQCLRGKNCDESDLQTLIRSRVVIRDVKAMRAESYDDETIGQMYSVDGLSRLYSGHTSVEEPVRVGNRVWIDTGIGWLENGRLTLEQI